MYSFSKKSIEKLETCHLDIQTIMYELIKIYDITVLEGIRTKEKQKMYFKQGLSKIDGINKVSKHQSNKDGVSMAIDIMPYKNGENAFSNKKTDIYRFYYLAGLIKSISENLYKNGRISHKVRWGGDWDSDSLYNDQSFNDLPHFELI